MSKKEKTKLDKAIETLKNPGGGVKLVSFGWKKIKKDVNSGG